MATSTYCTLSWRSAISVRGPDAAEFLQGLISNDIRRVSPDLSIWAAFLTAQGKFLHEFCVVREPPSGSEANDPSFLLECERDRRDHLLKRLSLYKLRANIVLSDADDRYVVCASNCDPAAFGLIGALGSTAIVDGAIIMVDPRHTALGVRILIPRNRPNWWADRQFVETAPADWDRQRISLALPDGSRDLVVEKSILLENGFSELNGVDWDKGCFLGQELTARTHYRALIRKRLVPFSFVGEPPVSGAAITQGDREVGTVRSHSGDLVLALVRLDALGGDAGMLVAEGGAILAPQLPDWLAAITQ